jgi:hypothetical protein
MALGSSTFLNIEKKYKKAAAAAAVGSKTQKAEAGEMRCKLLPRGQIASYRVVHM